MSLSNFPGVFARMALRNLRNGGQRTVIALLCILFGVMSLVGMATVAERMSTSVLSDPRFRFGGDLQLFPGSEEVITQQHLAQFEAMRERGQITDYMPLSTDHSVTLRTPQSGELHFLDQGIGIDPQLYPLVGDFVLQEPEGVTAAQLLNESDDVLLTRDLAAELALGVGDVVYVGDLDSGVTVEAQVRGIVGQTPDGYGNRLYYDLSTARLLAGSEAYLDSVIMTAPDPDAVQAVFQEQGWGAFPLEGYAETLRDTQEMFDLTLKGAGILGLLVAGIGIANTMQVLLARRTRDIAIFKTLGYSQRNMLVLFMLEAGLLGVIGSVLGTVAGVLISRWLVVLLGRTTTFMLEWAVHPPTLVMGLMVGVVTTLIFATVAIVRTSSVRPSALLRNESLVLDTSGRLKTVGLWALLAVPFTAITTLIMGSPLQGIGIVLFAVAGLLVLGGAFALLVKILPLLIPSRPFPLLDIALGSLRRRGLSLVFAMIALFVGTVTLTMAAVITQGAQRELDEEIVEIEGYDLTILAPADYEEEIEAAVSDQPVVDAGYELTARRISAPSTPDGAFTPILTGQKALTNMTIVEGPAWEEQVHGVYVYYAVGLEPGTQLEVELLDGRKVSLPIAGLYDIDFNQPSFGQDFGLLMHPQTLLDIAEPERVMFNLDVPDARLDEITTELGQALPDAIVINRYAYMNRFAQNYRNLFVFAVAMAGLALLAGVLLVANAVSLGMISRRYEIGVLKAVGYTRSHLLRMLAVEYSLGGVIAGVAGVIATVLILLITATLNDTAGNILTLDWSTAALMPVVTVSLTLLTVLIAAWKPTQLPPVTVLAAQE